MEARYCKALTWCITYVYMCGLKKPAHSTADVFILRPKKHSLVYFVSLKCNIHLYKNDDFCLSNVERTETFRSRTHMPVNSSGIKWPTGGAAEAFKLHYY